MEEDTTTTNVKVEDESEFRCYGELETPLIPLPLTSSTKMSAEEKIHLLRQDVLGAYSKFITPFGKKAMVYADWTASGRCLGRIEDYLRSTVLPFYGNTHTTASIVGHQSTCFRHEARQIVAECCNAKVTGKAAEDIVLFCGNGTTAAVDKLVNILGLRCPFTTGLDEEYIPVVFTSTYEHHSNLLPWRESVAEVVTIAYDPSTGVSLSDLEQKLQLFNNRKIKIGSFAAASNITGIMTDTIAVSVLMHRYGGIVCFDYATAAPYVKMDMNPVIITPNSEINGLAYKDAIFFSGHKLLGGPDSSGVLIVKRSLLPTKTETPSSSIGGGTVFYVTENHHRFLSNREEREEGGTPMLISDVKLGLAMHLKRSIGQTWIEQKELEMTAYVVKRLKDEPRIVLIGQEVLDQATHRLPIFSFLVRSSDRFLHFHFVSVLLNDLFGIQSRSGCMCAGPYAQKLLGLEPKVTERLEGAMLDKHEVLRPGFTRLSFPYWISQEEVDYIIEALFFIAEHGWKYLSLYRYNYKTGEWAHNTRLTRFPERLWLSKFDFFPRSVMHSHRNKSASAAPTALAMEEEEEASHTEESLAPTESASLPVSQVLHKDWQGVTSTVAGIFEHMLAEANADLRKMENGKEFKKFFTSNSVSSSGKPGGSNTSSDGLGTGYSLGDYESLRWFVTLEDIKKSAVPEGKNSFSVPLVEPIVGAIHPESYSRKLNSSVLPTRSSGAEVVGTVYAKIRNEIIKPRTGEEEILPRFLALAVKASASSQSFLQILRQNAYKYVQGAGATGNNGGTPSVGTLVAPLIDNDNSRRVTNEEAMDVVVNKAESSEQKSSRAEEEVSTVSDETKSNQPSTAAPQTSGADNGGCFGVIDETLTCPTNTCSLRPRPRPASLSMQPSLAANGKVLSGPGVTFFAASGDAAAASAAESSATSAIPAGYKFMAPPKKIMKLVGQAVKEWSMIEEGDRLLLGLSGGKDSLALLHILHALQKRAPIKFTIACATVDPQTDSFDPSALIPYVQGLGITYHYLSEPIVELASQKLQGDSLCAFCARFKRGLLYSCCRTHGYNKLVLAQHLDDLVESFLMSALHNGQIRTMKANYTIEAGDVRVIRPLIYVRESATRDFSQSAHLPIINENCPACFEQPKERARMKRLMEQEEAMVPALFYNMRKALIPLMHDDYYLTSRRIISAIEAAGTKPNSRPPSTKRRKNPHGNNPAQQGENEDGMDSNAQQVEDVEIEGEEVTSKSDEVGRANKRAKTVEEKTSETTDLPVCSLKQGQEEEDGGYCAACYELA